LETSFPYYQVYLELDITYEDKALNTLMAYQIYTHNNSVEVTGLGGVLVYHGLNSYGGSAFYAFDAACPYEVRKNVRINVDEDAIYAVCPTCGSKFELLNGYGSRVEGPSTENLKKYDVMTSGNKIIIRN